MLQWRLGWNGQTMKVVRQHLGNGEKSGIL